MVDRFANGDPSNDHAYGRGLGSDGSPVHSSSPGRFHGGDLAGLTDKVREGYFSSLGVNAIWISSPVEQVHGWVGGEEGAYPAYAYHGYWPLDFTAIDGNLGTEDDLRAFVDACHERGIRVVMDVVINHAGYNTLADMATFGFGALKADGWQDWQPDGSESWHDYHGRFIDYADSAAWSKWWGPAWIRANIEGYDSCGQTDLTTCTSSLPDFKTEYDREVPSPPFLVDKWRSEGRFDSLGLARARTPANHLIKWTTDWVRRFGIDGFRLDTARNLDLDTISNLKRAATSALAAWKEENPSRSLDDLEFWMTGEIFGHGVERSDYFDAGLNSVINFSFQSDVDAARVSLDSIYARYARAINGDASFNVLSYLSSHDTKLFDRSRIREAATRLMLLPGAVQIFYGDESGRLNGPPGAVGTDATRSAMNWDSVDEQLLEHWQKLGKFRTGHPAIAMGTHTVLADEPYTFSRTLRMGTLEDQVVVVLGAAGKTRVNVSSVYSDNTILRDAYTGKTSFVSYGMVYVDPADGGPVLLEEVR